MSLKAEASQPTWKPTARWPARSRELIIGGSLTSFEITGTAREAG
jgi:hypothetical protein